MDTLEAEFKRIQIKSPLEKLEAAEEYFLKPLKESGMNSVDLHSNKIKCLDVKMDTFPEIISEYEGFKGILLSSGKILQAFLNTYLGNLDHAEFDIAESKAFVDHCKTKDLLPQGYKSGYDYLIQLTEHYLKLKTNEATNEFSYPSFTTLSPLGKAAVLSARQMLFGTILYQDDTKIIEELINLDPSRWVWHYILCKRVRCVRRSTWNSSPSEKERQAIIQAFRLAPPEYTNYCMASYCQCLAEILKYRYTNRITGSINFGDRRFSNNNELFAFIEAHCRNILQAGKEGQISSGEALRIGEIFSSILPQSFRNYSMAKESFLIAERMRPHSSKLHHQFAKLYNNKRPKDIPCAVEQLKLSIKCNNVNLAAWRLLCQILYTCRPNRLTEFGDILNETMSDPECIDQDYAKLELIQICYLELVEQNKKVDSFQSNGDSMKLFNATWDNKVQCFK
jgi:hypothetical protein